MADVNDAVAHLYGASSQAGTESKNRRMTQHSRKWSSSGLGLDAAEAEARRLEKKRNIFCYYGRRGWHSHAQQG